MPVLIKPNSGKTIEKKVKNNVFYRYPVKTKTIYKEDDLLEILNQEAGEFLKNNDIVLVAESVVAITQGRVFKIDEIKYGFWAKFLSKFVVKTPVGIGLGTPQTMQLAIKEVGLLRIIFGAVISAVTKIFGIKGVL